MALHASASYLQCVHEAVITVEYDSFGLNYVTHATLNIDFNSSGATSCKFAASQALSHI